MIVTGELENVPLLEVFQVLAYSRQTGSLFVGDGTTAGIVVFDNGGIVCGESPSTRLLLAKAAHALDPQTHRALRRVQALACLTELMSLRKGVFKFTKHETPAVELAGVDIRSFYAAGTMATAELLMVLATAIDKKEEAPAPPPHEPGGQRAHPRYAPTLIEAELTVGGTKLRGYLTNLSAGGAFFSGDALPANDSAPELRFDLPGGIGAVTTRARVAWTRPDAIDGERGAGLAFEETTEDDGTKLRTYLDRFQQLADDMDLVG